MLFDEYANAVNFEIELIQAMRRLLGVEAV